MYLQHISTPDLIKARDAADYLLSFGGRLDSVLKIKLDTFHADVTAAIEDREPATSRQP